MLTRFNVSNFLSIFEKQEFSQLAANLRGKEDLTTSVNNLKILKYSSIYGANASGKSNIVKAISFSRNCILQGINNSNSADKYCKIHKENKVKETYFDYEIIIDKKLYSYGFTTLLNEGKITGEWFYKLNDRSSDECIFERNITENKFDYDKSFFSNDNNRKFSVWIEDSMQQKTSLLSTEIFKKQNPDSEFEIFRNLYLWFRDKLLILFPTTPFGSIDGIIQNDGNLLKMLEQLDTGIRSIAQKEVETAKLPPEFQNPIFLNMIKKSLKKNKNKAVISNPFYLFEVEIDKKDKLLFRKIVFKHTENNESEYLDYHEESDGTKRIIELLQAVDLSQRNGMTLIVDEIERSLHPLLIESILKYYFDMSTSFNSQLIITTHDQRLLNMEKVRKDCIWFVNKDYIGHTTIKSLDEYKIRNDLKIEKAYMEGRFGAIPMIGTLKVNDEDNIYERKD